VVALSEYMILFRIVHILAGVVWVGGLTMLVLYIQPSAKSLGPAGGPFVMELLARRKLPIFLLSAGAVTIVAGGFLYWRDWQAVGSLGDWLDTRFGTTLTIGAGAALAGWLIGLLGVKPTVDRMLGLAKELASSGGPPPPERAAELQALQLRSRRLAILVLVLVATGALAMSIARYW
jgi:uncharacterized membrane protein